jgi:hypothetical protein
MPLHRLLPFVAAVALVVAANVVQAVEQPAAFQEPGPQVLPPPPGAAPTGPPVVPPPTDSTFTVRVPDLTPGFAFHAGFLYLQPSADNLGWAVLTNVKNLASPAPIASPFWTIETLTPGYQPGFEIGGSYTFAGSGADVQVNWQHLRTSTSDSVAAQEGIQWVSPFSQTGPSSAQSFKDLGDSQGVNKLRSAAGQVNFAYDAVNLDLGQHVAIGPLMRLRFFGGVSYARLQERLVSSFFGAPPDATATFPQNVPLSISLNSTSTYNGAGPRFGIDPTCELPGGFRLTGQLAGALLIGRKQPAQYEFTATAPDLAAVGIGVNREYIGSDAFTQVVYSGNAKLGLGYSYVFGSGSIFTLETGYLAAIYLDAFSTYETNHNVLPLQVGSLSTASMRHTLSNFTVNGLYFTGGLQW